MSLTRANVEAVLVKRVGPLLTKAGMATTVAGLNADLNDPIGWAVRQVGYTVSDITSVSNSDISAVQSDEYDEFLDFAELKTLENISGNLDDVTVKLGPRSENLSDLVSQVEKKIARLEGKLKRLYGYGADSLQTGILENDFAEHYPVNE